MNNFQENINQILILNKGFEQGKEGTPELENQRRMKKAINKPVHVLVDSKGYFPNKNCNTAVLYVDIII